MATNTTVFRFNRPQAVRVPEAVALDDRCAR